MKKLISLLCVPLLFMGCQTLKNFQFTDLEITAGATIAARGALLAIPSNKVPAVKNWMYFIATRMRTLTGSPTPQDLLNLLNSSIPPQFLAQFPELQAVIFPAIVDFYSQVYSQFQGSNASLLKVINDIAVGVETAAAP